MSVDGFRSVEARLGRLERQNRQLRIGLFLCSLALICLVAMGQVKGRTEVEAQKFVLTNAAGEPRAELTTLDGDYSVLRLRSPNGEKEAEISAQGLSLSDHGLPGSIPVAHYGPVGLYLSDPKGNIVVQIGGAGSKVPQLTALPEIAIFDNKGREVWRAPIRN